MSIQIRILTLGSIITPDIRKTLEAFTDLIHKKLGSSDQETPTKTAVSQRIGTILHTNNLIIEQFKLGEIPEDIFTKHMIDEIKKTTNIELTTVEFDSAWNAMNPKFESFKDLLEQAISFNTKPGQQIIFISFTNPKDMKHLTEELQKNAKKCVLADNNLVEICGIQLHASCTHRTGLSQLLAHATNQSGTQPASIFRPKTAVQTERPCFELVLSNTEFPNTPVLNGVKTDYLELLKTAKDLSIPIISWDKTSPLSDILTASAGKNVTPTSS